MTFTQRVVVGLLLLLGLGAGACTRTAGNSGAVGGPRKEAPAPAEVLAGLRSFYERTARADGSFAPGIDPDYAGMSDSVYSDLAAVTYACTLHRTVGWTLPNEEATAAFLLSRQLESGDFFNVAGTVDPKSAEGRTYNTTQGLVALRALGRKPRHDPLPVFEEILKADYKTLPAFSTSFFPLAYLCYDKPIPPKADRGIRALMVQDETGYTNDHIAATFHASHYYALVGEPTPKSRQMVDRILRDQNADGSWLLNMPSRDRHATFDAVFTLVHEGHGRADARAAVQRAAAWALSCRNPDGGFGHYPGSASDADANYFQVGTLVMAGFLKPVDPLPPDPHLLSWGHMMPVRPRTAQGAPPLRWELPGWVGGVAFSDDGARLVTGTSDGVARTWDARTGKRLAEFKGHANTVGAVAFSPDGKMLATGSYDHVVRTWDAATGRPRHTLSGHRGAVMAVAFAPRGPAVLASASIDRTIKLWDPRTGEPRRTLEGHKSWVNAVAFSPDGATLYSASSDGTVKVWDVATGEARRTVPASKAEVRSIAVSADGSLVAVGLRYGSIKVWDTADWRERPAIAGLSGDVWAVRFTADGQLVSGSGDWNAAGQITLWDTTTAKQLRQLNHTGEVLSLAISPTDGRIAAGGGDRTVSIYERVGAK